MGKIYFAHAVNSYNTPIERAFLELIVVRLTGGDRSLIENPNQPHHQEGYKRYDQKIQEKRSGMTRSGMGYFYDEVIQPVCTNGCVGVPFLDKKFGSGVGKEMQLNIKLSRPSWFVDMFRAPSERDLREFINNPLNGVFYVRHSTLSERELVINMDPLLVLSREETRLRTWKIYEQVMRPYEEAHLVNLPIPEGFYPNG